jgi:DNA-directed RNA polymerase subunit RPC12/RpoP
MVKLKCNFCEEEADFDKEVLEGQEMVACPNCGELIELEKEREEMEREEEESEDTSFED